jgi:hypothetical protein
MSDPITAPRFHGLSQETRGATSWKRAAGCGLRVVRATAAAEYRGGAGRRSAMWDVSARTTSGTSAGPDAVEAVAVAVHSNDIPRASRSARCGYGAVSWTRTGCSSTTARLFQTRGTTNLMGHERTAMEREEYFAECRDPKDSIVFPRPLTSRASCRNMQDPKGPRSRSAPCRRWTDVDSRPLRLLPLLPDPCDRGRRARLAVADRVQPARARVRAVPRRSTRIRSVGGRRWWRRPRPMGGRRSEVIRAAPLRDRLCVVTELRLRRPRNGRRSIWGWIAWSALDTGRGFMVFGNGTATRDRCRSTEPVQRTLRSAGRNVAACITAPAGHDVAARGRAGFSDPFCARPSAEARGTSTGDPAKSDAAAAGKHSSSSALGRRYRACHGPTSPRSTTPQKRRPEELTHRLDPS